MMDELVVFAELTKFNIIFLRRQDVFYSDKIKILEDKGINVIYLNTRNIFSVSRFRFCFIFIIRHLKCFLNLHSLIYGLKSIGYFLMLDFKIFKEEKIEMHCQFATQSTIMGLMIKEYLKTNVSYSFTYHAYDIFVKNLWFTTLTTNAEKAFSISNFNIDYVIRNYKIKDKSKIHYLPLGVFTPEIAPTRISFTDRNILRLGFLSYFVEMKGINYLLPAINKLKNSNIRFVINIAGDGPLKEDMISFVEKNSLKEYVIFHGLIKNEDKDRFYRKLDLFILPSISKGIETDGLPVVLMEAVSYGLPIISTNVSGIPEICINNYNGYLIQQKSVEEIVNAITKFYNSPSKWQEFSHNSLEISNKYNIVDNSKYKLKMLGWD